MEEETKNHEQHESKKHSNTPLIVIGISVFVSLAVIAGAFVVAASRRSPSVGTGDQNKTISQEELKAADGKNGHECLVAVDGTVYKIEGFALWQNGQHIPSNGQAYCGADLSNVIDKAPHGRSKLKELTVVGTLPK
jgi:predicted heme/steroid binding protein